MKTVEKFCSNFNMRIHLLKKEGTPKNKVRAYILIYSLLF